MKYFEEYQLLNNDNCFNGIYHSIKHNLGYVLLDNQEDIVLIEDFILINRAIHKDKVQVDIIEINKYKNDYQSILYLSQKYNILGNGKINYIYQRNIKTISGILHIQSKINYGYNKKNIPIYLFTSTNYKYPNFLVTSNYKKTNKHSHLDIYVVIELKEWNSNQKLPLGICNQVIGEVGIIENEYLNLLYNHQLYQPNYKSKLINQIQNDINNSYNLDNKNRKDFTDLNVFSIDPVGCLDIDDATHLKEYNDYYEIGIHIADVSNFVIENTELDTEAQKRLFTIYSPHKNYNMLPDILSENICSLLPNQNRKAVSLILKIDKNSYDIIDYQFYLSTIYNHKAYSYEEAQNIINLNKNNNMNNIDNIDNVNNDSQLELDLINLYTIIKNINFYYHSNIDIYDTHQMIEKLMIITNHYVAKKIYNIYPELCILRTHQNNNNNIDNINANIITKYNLENDKLNQYLNIIQMKSAKYKLIDKYNNQNSHDGLGIDLYTHFTSPIRRYIDIINHRIIKDIINNNTISKNNDIEKIKNICNDSNIIQQNIKKYQRDIDKIIFISYQLDNQIINAYIINIKPKNNQIQIYLTDYNLSFLIYIIQPNLSHLLEINYSSNLEYFDIINKQNKDRYRYNLYQEIYILISTDIKEKNYNKKCMITLLDNDKNKLIDL